MPTLATLRSGVASKLGLDNTASSAEQVLLDSWLNEGIREILLATHCTVELGTMATVASTWQYQLDTDILAIRDLWREDSASDVQPMYHVTAGEILDLQRAGASNDAAYTRYAVEGSNLLLLWPTPSSVFTLQLHYVPSPTELAATSDDPSSATFGRIPSEFHKSIEYYALWQGAEFDENRTSQGGERYRLLYEESIKKMRAGIQRKGHRQLAPARTRAWRAGIRAPRNNDRYPYR